MLVEWQLEQEAYLCIRGYRQPFFGLRGLDQIINKDFSRFFLPSP
jgi:hypothetical protein